MFSVLKYMSDQMNTSILIILHHFNTLIKKSPTILGQIKA